VEDEKQQTANQSLVEETTTLQRRAAGDAAVQDQAPNEPVKAPEGRAELIQTHEVCYLRNLIWSLPVL